MKLPTSSIEQIRRVLHLSEMQQSVSLEAMASPDALEDTSSGQPEEDLFTAYEIEKILTLLNAFDTREATILRMRYGLLDGTPKTLKEIGVELGLTRERVRQIENQTLRKLYTSAFQSDLLNRVIAQRIDSIDRVLVGDLAWKHINGACFRVEDADVEQPRCASFEISPTGPLFGPRMTEPTGYPAQVETQVLADAGLTRDQVRGGYSVKLEGARRPLRVPIRDVESHNGTDANGPFLRVAFVLPPGAYATSVTRELCRGVASMPPPQPHSAPASQANP
jgi:hypothetical protein